MTEILRTPDEAFDGLPDFPFDPHYFQWGEIRMHYLDEGAGPPVVLSTASRPGHSSIIR